MAPGHGELIWGPLLHSAGTSPLCLRTLLCDLRPRFLDKGRAGRGYRAVARNGRVLLASPLPLAELVGRAVRLRLQAWHRAILPGDSPEPWGILLCVHLEDRPGSEPPFTTRLAFPCAGESDLCLDVGGGLVLEFRRDASQFR